MSKSATTSRPDPTPGAPHNYLRALPRWVAANPPAPGRLTEVETLHDDWCGIFHGHRCHCEPAFRWRQDAR